MPFITPPYLRFCDAAQKRFVFGDQCISVTDMAGETMQDLLTKKDSKSRQYCELYVYQFVSRYKDDPSILFWEVCNELNLGADLPLNRGEASNGRCGIAWAR